MKPGGAELELCGYWEPYGLGGAVWSFVGKAELTEVWRTIAGVGRGCVGQGESAGIVSD